MNLRNASVTNSLSALLSIGIPAATVLDVGIQDGTPALMSALPDRHHVLFEPVAEYTERIERAYADIAHTLVPVAVSDVDSHAFLLPEFKTRGEEVSHAFLVESEEPGTRPITSMRLDTYLAGSRYEEPYLLKIDVEGSEIPRRILLGATETLKRTSIVVIEMTSLSSTSSRTCWTSVASPSGTCANPATTAAHCGRLTGFSCARI